MRVTQGYLRYQTFPYKVAGAAAKAFYTFQSFNQLARKLFIWKNESHNSHLNMDQYKNNHENKVAERESRWLMSDCVCVFVGPKTGKVCVTTGGAIKSLISQPGNWVGG